eukprot:1159995-Pelagomonas_calceolata.AAC.4
MDDHASLGIRKLNTMLIAALIKLYHTKPTASPASGHMQAANMYERMLIKPTCRSISFAIIVSMLEPGKKAKNNPHLCMHATRAQLAHRHGAGRAAARGWTGAHLTGDHLK